MIEKSSKLFARCLDFSLARKDNFLYLLPTLLKKVLAATPVPTFPSQSTSIGCPTFGPPHRTLIMMHGITSHCPGKMILLFFPLLRIQSKSMAQFFFVLVFSCFTQRQRGSINYRVLINING